MGGAARILKNYDTYILLLKFSIRNNEEIEFRDYNLVDCLIQFLKQINSKLREEYGLKLVDSDEDPKNFEALIKSIFRDDWSIKQYAPYINSEEKRELISLSQLILKMSDMASERLPEDIEEGGLGWLMDVHKELEKIKLLFLPILKKIKVKIEEHEFIFRY